LREKFHTQLKSCLIYQFTLTNNGCLPVIGDGGFVKYQYYESVNFFNHLIKNKAKSVILCSIESSMPAKSKSKPPDPNTEAMIKTAARAVFHRKGFAATRTRDIAEEANMNLALLNYYFKSKKKLFDLIMFETLTTFFQTMGIVFNDAKTTLEKKIELIAEKYIEVIIAEPEIPLFIMSEIRSHGAAVLEKLPVVNVILQSHFIKQYREAVKNGKIAEPNPLHFLMNIMGLVIFPFIASPMIKKLGQLNDRQFDKLMQERKKIIPVWMKAILKAKYSRTNQLK